MTDKQYEKLFDKKIILRDNKAMLFTTEFLMSRPEEEYSKSNLDNEFYSYFGIFPCENDKKLSIIIFEEIEMVVVAGLLCPLDTALTLEMLFMEMSAKYKDINMISDEIYEISSYILLKAFEAFELYKNSDEEAKSLQHQIILKTPSYKSERSLYSALEYLENRMKIIEDFLEISDKNIDKEIENEK